ncbi:MAG: 3-phosphoshikimate 1-carboxyvinyltransferase [Prevotella sp.]|nr:3-phosphoshikimate 1-carboxyvinyltransferase [Prevotella sp.]
MQYQISAPARLDATIKLPASKSISNRALIIHALSGGNLVPENLSDCDDTEVIINALRDMPAEINIKAAGTAMRFMTALLASTPCGEHIITGTERMKHRPIKVLVDALLQLGANIEYAGQEGFPPLRINGARLEGGQIEIAGNVSSQYISALLMIGPMLSKGLELHLTGDIISRPYIDLTLWTMREFGANAEWTSIDTILVKPQSYASRTYYIENDWSAASYWYEMVALSLQDDAEVRLEGLMDGSKQGDSSVRYIFSLLGVKTVFGSKKPGKPTTVTIRKSGHRVPRLEYDFVNSPDLAQTFVVTCALLGVPFRFTGLQTLKIKETDRIEALKREMLKLGYVLRDVNGQELVWDGERTDAAPHPAIDTYDDHRMALAFAPAALRQPVVINNPQVVTKSYPHFWNDLEKAGFGIARQTEE